MSFVLDASVTMAWLFEDESSQHTEIILERLNDEQALAPELWLYEVANVLIMGERRQRLTEAQSRRFIELLLALPIEIVPNDKSTLWSSLISLAREQGISAYDAAYLDTAMRKGIPLATQDKALKKAAQRTGVAVI
ncbi:MAG: type II toxin-antitoxin system VapC family toxin [Gammaproteobacteria bacterium]